MKQKVLLLAFLLSSCFLCGQDIDTLLSMLKTANDTSKLFIFCDLSDGYLSVNNNYASMYADSAIKYSQKLESDYHLSFAYRTKGQASYKQGNYETAILYYEKAKQLAELFEAPELLYLIYNDMGLVYGMHNKTQTALKYYNLAIKNARILEQNEAIAALLINIADLLSVDNDYEKIMQYYDSALNITNDNDIKIAAYNNIAHFQYLTGDKEKAHKTYDTLLNILSTGCDNHIYVSALNNLVKINIIEGDLNLAKQRLLIIDSISRENSYNDIRVKMYQYYHDLYTQLGDFEKSCFYLEEFDALNDSIHSSVLTERLNELENKHYQEKINQELQQQEAELRFQETINNILIIIAILVTISVLVVLFLLLQKNKLNRQLKVVNTSLKNRDEEISSNLAYARQIQLGCMRQSAKSKTSTFVFDKPKSVVGGDFFINVNKSGTDYYFLGDCTGHGISGGFLSVLAIETINMALDKYSNLSDIASSINNEFFRVVSSADNLVGESFCLSIVGIKDGKMQFLTSKHKLWIVYQDQITEYKQANPIIGNQLDNTFVADYIDLQQGTTIFLSSDGYPDQFGSNNRGKLKYKEFRRLLLECSNMQPNDAKNFLERELNIWQEDVEQTDDIMVVGIYSC